MPKTLATATVDRLLHHAHLCQTSGDSIRLSQAIDRQGGESPDLILKRAGPVATPGQISWPPPGSFHDRQRAIPNVP